MNQQQVFRLVVVVVLAFSVGCASSTRFVKAGLTKPDHDLSQFEHVPVAVQVNLKSRQPGLYFRLWSLWADASFTSDTISVPLFNNMFLASDAPPHELSGDSLTMPLILDMQAGRYSIRQLRITDLATFNSSRPGAKSATHLLYPKVGFTVRPGQPVFLGQWTIHVHGVEKVGHEFVAKVAFDLKPGNAADFADFVARFPALKQRKFSFGALEFD